MPFILFILSFILRLSLISKGPYHIDCLHLALQAERTLDTGQLQYLFGPGYPLTVLISAIFVSFTRNLFIADPIIAVNFMSVIFSSLSVVVFYDFVLKLFNHINTSKPSSSTQTKISSSRIALLSAITLSLSPIFLGISVYGKSHAPAIYFLLTSLYYLLKHKETFQQRHLYLSGAAFGLMGATRLQDMILMFIPMLYFLFYKRTKTYSYNKSIFSIVLFFIIAGITATLFHAPFLLNKNIASYGSQFSLFWQSGLTTNFRGIFSSSLLSVFKFFIINSTLIGVIVAVLGLGLLAKKNSKLAGFLFLWILIPLLYYGNLFTTAPRFFVLILPPFIITIAYLIEYFITINATFRTAALTTYCLMIFMTFSYIYPILLDRHNRARLVEYVEWVGRHTEENARIMTTHEGRFLKYYAQRKSLNRPTGRGLLKPEDIDAFKHKLDSLLDKNIPIYATWAGLFVADPYEQFSKFIWKHYDVKLIGAHTYESWHRGAIRQNILHLELFKIEKKTLE